MSPTPFAATTPLSVRILPEFTHVGADTRNGS